MKRAKATPLPDLSKVWPLQESAEHHTRCPICGHKRRFKSRHKPIPISQQDQHHLRSRPRQKGGLRTPLTRMATTRLLELTNGHPVVCDDRGRDRYGRTIAVCRAHGEDLGAIMVRPGMAWAFTRYSRDYVDQEAKAKAERLGVHAHDCQPAWEWRAQQRAGTSR